jgi:hypothetical protein
MLFLGGCALLASVFVLIVRVVPAAQTAGTRDFSRVLLTPKKRG